MILFPDHIPHVFGVPTKVVTQYSKNYAQHRTTLVYKVNHSLLKNPLVYQQIRTIYVRKLRDSSAAICSKCEKTQCPDVQTPTPDDFGCFWESPFIYTKSFSRWCSIIECCSIMNHCKSGWKSVFIDISGCVLVMFAGKDVRIPWIFKRDFNRRLVATGQRSASAVYDGRLINGEATADQRWLGLTLC